MLHLHSGLLYMSKGWCSGTQPGQLSCIVPLVCCPVLRQALAASSRPQKMLLTQAHWTFPMKSSKVHAHLARLD